MSKQSLRDQKGKIDKYEEAKMKKKINAAADRKNITTPESSVRPQSKLMSDTKSVDKSVEKNATESKTDNMDVIDETMQMNKFELIESKHEDLAFKFYE